jgi:cell fate regulator YaaT (PSP1 superfamily)
MACTGCNFKDTITPGIRSTTIAEESLNACNKLNTYDWLDDLPELDDNSNIVEIRFKNTRKEFFRNDNDIKIVRGELLTVEGQYGYDVGIVSLKGRLAEKQFIRKVNNSDAGTLKIIYRKSNISDIQSWKEAKELEHPVMIRSRQIAQSLNLEMKIGDVEYQADKKKATFYYTADERIDFRELIKIFIAEFKVKVEMKQIGARQEAGRIGGIGSCGRELCCSSWRTELPSVQQSAVHKQNLSASNEKFLGQCGKLKCCLMYELETYLEAKEEFPKELIELGMKNGILYPYKIDILKKVIWYTDNMDAPGNVVPITLDRVREIIMLNKKGLKAENVEA